MEAATTEKVRDLLESMAQGDQRSLEQIFKLFYPWLHAVSIAIVREKVVAEEIVEDIFYELWENREECVRIINIESYLRTLVRNRSLDHYRKQSRRHFVDIEETADLADQLSPEDIFLFDELKRHIDKAILALPPKCADVFQLVRIEGNSYKKVAGILGISPKTVENQLAIAVKKITSSLRVYINENPEVSKQAKIRPLIISGLLSIFVG